MHWSEVAKRELSLAVHCDGSTAQLHALLWLAGRARLTALRFCQAQDDGAAAAAVFELLTHRPLIAAAGRHLRALAGVPSASVAGGRREQAHPFPLAAFPALQALQFYVPPQLQVLSLRDGGAGWGGAAALRRLDVSGRHYVAVRALPPHLRHLSVSAWHVLLEPRVVACCAHVEVHAEAVLLSEHVLPYASLAGAATAAAAAQQLAELAAALAGAGLPPGHEMRLTTNLVCFQTVPCHDSRRLQQASDAQPEAPAMPMPAAAARGAAAAPVPEASEGVLCSLAGCFPAFSAAEIAPAPAPEVFAFVVAPSPVGEVGEGVRKLLSSWS
ncbi:hypothetical protein C2E20_2708 [Micractinium conductrix]|uniref:Uncharacterized protein n=1 Tax=Micractinium conductrix TaxID=554055 RepID=A0A2P6VJS1_9CHLO|nr:hypothetical protein C2E20_2708 [Micractinium conductrix]|eukprot:PSC74342.1 hypothetical protein C2E20_2708 [Micractinium conductrix]